MICETHDWTRKTLPCPFLWCPQGVRSHWTITGKKKKVVYVRRRIKDVLGPRYEWEKTTFVAAELLAGRLEAEEEDDLVF